MPVFDRAMPTGFSGAVSRTLHAVLEPVLLEVPLAYGSPVQLNSKGNAVAATDAAKVYGFLSRPYPTTSTSNDFGTALAPANTIQDILRSGYMHVRLAKAETAVPVRETPTKLVTTVTGSFVVGDLAVTPGTAIPKCTYMGAPDEANTVEIAFNI